MSAKIEEQLMQKSFEIRSGKDASFNGDSFQDSNVIYTALYSGTQVIELTIRGVAVMRRRNDSWFNATQILKISGLEKSQRTKALEKEVHTGVHDKVQGGYGKFQGTWIPYDRAVSLAQQYGVYEELKPLFLYNASSPEANNTPTKEQALAAQRKRSHNIDSFTGKSPALNASAGNSFYKAMSRQPSALGKSYSTLTDNDENEVPENLESPTKKQKLDQNQDKLSANNNGGSIEIHEHDLDIENPNTPFTLEPLAGYIPNYEHSKEVITQIFLGQDITTLAEAVGDKTLLSNVELDVAIDELGHTALHWASALARISLVEELVRRGSVRLRGNSNGESPLIRAVLVTNNYDQSSFNDLLDLLYPCIPLLDHQRRSVLHHIALTAGIKKRSSASRYYLETLLEWIVRTGSYLSKGAITLGKFMNEIVNAQDKNGDTALNIAARIGNKAIVQQLLDVGADPSIPNRAGLRAMDFGINVSGLNAVSTSKAPTNGANTSKSYSSNGQSSQKILDSMQQVLVRLDSDFKTEMATKQKSIDELHSRLREATLRLSDSRKKVDSLKQSEVELNELKQKINNLDKATNEEEQRFIDQTTELGAIGNYDVDFDADEPFRISTVYEQFVLRLSHEPNQPLDSVSIDLNSINPSELPPANVLKARIKAYKENENNLSKIIKDLASSSATLESKFRRVVSLCTGVTEDKIDGILDGLVQAVESDPDEVDMGRVVGFLKKVDDRIED